MAPTTGDSPKLVNEDANNLTPVEPVSISTFGISTHVDVPGLQTVIVTNGRL